MPQFTITFSDAQLVKIQAVVDTFNANSGNSFTVKQWLDLHLQELAIGNELAVLIGTLQKQEEADAKTRLDAAITTARDDLIAGL